MQDFLIQSKRKRTKSAAIIEEICTTRISFRI